MYTVVYKTYFGKENEEVFEILFLAEEYVNELSKQSLIQYVYIQKNN